MQRTGTGSAALLDLLRLRKASAYGAGGGLDEALDVARRLASDGIPCTLGYSPMDDEAGRLVTDVQVESFARLAGEGLDGYVSAKLPGIGFDAGLFDELVAAAAAAGRRLHLDGMRADTVDPTFGLLERAAGHGPLGTTLPGRWRRSVDDAGRAMDLGLTIRVVKGHWPDDEHGNLDPGDGFLKVIDRLCGYQGGVAVATHNVKLLRESLRRLAASGTPCGSELFLGMPFAGPANAAREAGVPIRVYVPYGNAWASYGVRDLAAHPATAMWLLQDLLFGREKTWRAIKRSRPRS